MVEYHPTWSEDELAAILHRLSEAGGGEARFGQDENDAVTGVDNPQELERALFNVGYAQRPASLPKRAPCSRQTARRPS